MNSNMVPSRFYSLAILHGHKNLTRELNLIDVANDFCSKIESIKKCFEAFKSNKVVKMFSKQCIIIIQAHSSKILFVIISSYLR